MKKDRQSRIASKASNKGRAVSFLIHCLLLLIAFLPFLSMQSPQEPTKEALVIQFDFPYNNYVAPEKFVEEKQVGSQMSGSEAGGSTPSEAPIQPRPVEAAPSSLSKPTVTAVNRTSSTLLSSPMSDFKLPTPKISTNSPWQPVNDAGDVESDGIEPLKEIKWAGGDTGDASGSGEGDDDSDIWNDGFGSGTGGSGTGSGGGPGNATGKGSGPGGGTGTGGAGKGSGVGGIATNGIKWDVAYGEGDLDRGLIKRSSKSGSLAVKEGKLCLYLCVDRNGKVVSSQYNLAKSTIKDIPLLTKAVEASKEYQFAPDITAPPSECGNFYFVFKFD